MASVGNSLKIVNIAPPIKLPSIFVTVKVGQTLIITRSMIDQASIYYHEQSQPLGSIQIIGGTVNYQHLLNNSNRPITKAYLTNAGQRVFRDDVSPSIYSGVVSIATINSGNFKIVGVNMTDPNYRPVCYVYKATAGVQGAESVFSEVTGVIIVNVVSATNNKPNSLKSGEQDVVIGGMSPILGATVTHLYSDPEGDAPHKLKITALPTKGTLYYLGAPVNVGVEIPISSVNAGLLVYVNNAAISQVGGFDEFASTVSDVGSGLYY